MRLTGKIGNEYKLRMSANKEENTLAEGIKKLGQLEDIEDELGMDTLTFFKCLKATKIYAKDLGYVETDLYFLNGDDMSKWGFDIYDGTTFSFKDYGKTWALTKEGLL